MSVKRALVILIASFFVGLAAGASDESDRRSDTAEVIDFEGPLDEDGVPRHWLLKTKKGEVRFRVEDDAGPDGERALRLESCQSSFSLNRDVSVEPSTHPILRWSWKATELPEGGDLRDSGRNDQAVQLLLAFDGNRLISYVWDTSAPVGTTTDESYRFLGFGLSVKVLVVESGDKHLDKWVVVSRNIVDDYRRLYGAEPPKLVAVRVQSNSQYTRTAGSGLFGRIRFLPATDATSQVPAVPSRIVSLGQQTDRCEHGPITISTVAGETLQVGAGESRWARVEIPPEGVLIWCSDAGPRMTRLNWRETNLLRVVRGSNEQTVRWRCYRSMNDEAP